MLKPHLPYSLIPPGRRATRRPTLRSDDGPVGPVDRTPPESDAPDGSPLSPGVRNPTSRRNHA